MDMHIIPTGQSERRDGNEIGRYGLDTDNGNTLFVWYQRGYGTDPRKWEMEQQVEWQLSISVDIVLIVDDEKGLYAFDRQAFADANNEVEAADVPQYGVSTDDPYMKYLGDPSDYLNGNLYIERENHE